MEKIIPTSSTKYLTLSTKQKVLSTYEVNKVISSIDFLNPRFFGWYCKCLKVLGINKFLDIVDVARKGKNPQTLLSYLLKQETN